MTETIDIGLPISEKEFQTLVIDYLDRMQSNLQMKTEDYITMARLWNTITFCRLEQKNALYNRYTSEFFPAQVERVSKNLDAQVTKGMALYSKKYDIFIGGKPHPNSQFKLI